MADCITNIGLDCNMIIAVNGTLLSQLEEPCQKYGSELSLNFNQAVTGISIPIIGIDGSSIILSGNYLPDYSGPGGELTIANSSDGDLNTIFTINSVSYDETTNETTIDCGVSTSITENFGNVVLIEPCAYQLTYTVENTDTGELIVSDDITGTDDPLIQTVTTTLNTIGNVRVTIEFTSCLGYQKCVQDIHVCAKSYFESTCHEHTISLRYGAMAEDSETLGFTLYIYKLNSDGSKTLTTTYEIGSVSEFDYLFTATVDGEYYYEIYSYVVNGDRDSDVLVSSGIIIDICDIRACWATILAAEYCCDCTSDCDPSDTDCIDKAKIEKQARRNALNVMSSDMFMILNLTEELNNQWTTKNPVYIEEYKNDLVKLYEVINHLSTYTKNCTVCG
jgi:hypothetical protein